MYRSFGRLGIVIVMALTVVTFGDPWLGESAGTTASPRSHVVDGSPKPTPVTTVPTPVTTVPTPAPTPPHAGSQTAISYGPEAFQLLDLQWPDPATHPGPRPVLLYLHSGGWIAGDRTGVPDVVLAQIDRGYAVASADYRLAGATPDGQPIASFPGAIWDVKRAIRFLKANAATWNLDPSRVILTGASAGGYLAAFVGATAGQFEPPDLPKTFNRRTDSSVKAIVDLVGPTDLVTFEPTDHPWAAPLTASFLGCTAPTAENPLTCPDDLLETASVAPWVDQSDPPIFLGYGADDTLVVAGTQGGPLDRAWVTAHHGNASSAEYDVVQGAGHTLPFEDTVTALTEFFDQVASGQTSVASL